MKLDIKKLSASVKVYGEKLYVESTVIGTVALSEEGVSLEGNTLKIEIGEGRSLYARIKQAVLDEGIKDDQVFTIQEFTASRDAQGETENGVWSVKKDEVKLFAL